MKQTALTLELRQDNPNIICRWDEHGVSHHKELSFKMMGTLIEQAVQYDLYRSASTQLFGLCEGQKWTGTDRTSCGNDLYGHPISWHLVPSFSIASDFICVYLCAGAKDQRYQDGRGRSRLFAACNKTVLLSLFQCIKERTFVCGMQYHAQMQQLTYVVQCAGIHYVDAEQRRPFFSGTK